MACCFYLEHDAADGGGDCSSLIDDSVGNGCSRDNNNNDSERDVGI